MEKITESKISEADRIKFIRTIEGYEKINPYLDLSKIADVKRLLHENGYYAHHVQQIQDSSVANLIIKAQNKKPKRMSAKSQHRKTKIYSV